jgi:hypothetical protein
VALLPAVQGEWEDACKILSQGLDFIQTVGGQAKQAGFCQKAGQYHSGLLGVAQRT